MPTDAGSSDPGQWLDGYVERVRDLLSDAARANAEIVANLSESSLGDEEWTAATITADAIEAWEQVTPLTGEGIDLWLELVQRSLPPLPPVTAPDVRRTDASAAATRLARYLDLWESANGKLSAGTYRSEDLVDDWFTWVGLAARDATAALTLLTRAAPEARPPTGSDDAAS
jgi:hypothetical protein